MPATKKTAPLPTSKAKTAYALLSEIATLILKEPKRYNQERFLVVRGGPEVAPRGFPSCGTVACVAGWVVALKGPAKTATPYNDVQYVAARILGLDHFQQSRLFSGNALMTVSDRTDSVLTPKPQTLAHARAGIRHIRRFQKRHKAQLLETTV